MNSEELKEITQQLADVEPPPAPDWQPLIIAVVIVIAATLLAVVVIRLRSRRKHSSHASDKNRDALYQLQLLQQARQQNEIGDHDVAYRLATLLRLGLGLNQLTDTPPPALQSDQQQWQELIRLLARLRYQPGKKPRHSGECRNLETLAQKHAMTLSPDKRESGDVLNDSGRLDCPIRASRGRLSGIHRNDDVLTTETFAQIEQWLKQESPPC